MCYVETVDDHIPIIDEDAAGNGIEECCLAGSIAPYDRDEITL